MTSRDNPPVVINGRATDCLSSLDRGLSYGDGVFETIAVEDGRPRFWLRHLARLHAGCARLVIPYPEEKRLLEESWRAQGMGVKIIVLAARTAPAHRWIVQLHPWPDYPETCREAGVRVRLCRQRLGQNPALAGIKHLNRLEQVIARGEWDDPGIREGLLLDGDERLVEGTMSNLFLVRDRVLMTPELVRCGVAGILRTVVMEQAARVPMQVQVKAS
jgi:4-amino-4-deoxychorismate lyase